jgi:hypothetical protein
MLLEKQPRQKTCKLKQIRILEAYHNGENYINIAKQLDVKRKTAHTIVYRNKNNGNSLEKLKEDTTDISNLKAPGIQIKRANEEFTSAIARDILEDTQKEKTQLMCLYTEEPIERRLFQLQQVINKLAQKLKVYEYPTTSKQPQQESKELTSIPTDKHSNPDDDAKQHKKAAKLTNNSPVYNNVFSNAQRLKQLLHLRKSNVENETKMDANKEIVVKCKKRSGLNWRHIRKLKNQKKYRAKKIIPNDVENDPKIDDIKEIIVEREKRNSVSWLDTMKLKKKKKHRAKKIRLQQKKCAD